MHEKYKGINVSNPCADSSIMKSSNAIIYRMEINKYLLMFQCKTKLKTYETMGEGDDSTWIQRN